MHFATELGLDTEWICARELLYTRDEAEILFASVGVELPPIDLDHVHRQVAGIPDLMVVAASVVKSLPEGSRHREQISRSLARAMDSRMRTRMLAGDGSDAADFALTLSAASIVTPPIARLLTGAEEVQEKLSALEASGLLVRTTESERSADPEWAFAPAVRDALLAIRVASGTRPAPAMVALARHCLSTRDYAAAVRYAVEAKAWPLAIELLEQHWDQLVPDDLDLLRDTVAGIPTALLDGHPALQAARAVFTQRPSTPPPLPDDPAELRALGATSAAWNHLTVGTANVLILRTMGDRPRAAELARQLSCLAQGALDGQRADILRQLPILRLTWGVTHLLAGDFVAALAELRCAYTEALRKDSHFAARTAGALTAMTWAVLGGRDQVAEWLELDATEQAPEQPVRGHGSVSHTATQVARALTALDRLDTTAARRTLDELGEASGSDELWEFVTYAHARYASIIGDAYAGMVVLQRATSGQPQHAGRPGHTCSLLTAAEMDLRLALGEGTRALALSDSARTGGPMTLVSAARAHLLTGSPARAIAMCRSISWKAGPFARAHLESMLIETAAHRTLGENREAARIWSRVCAAVDRTGMTAVLATVPQDLVKMLHAEGRTNSPAVAAFLASDVREVFPPAVSSAALTRRERELLVEIVRGLSSTEIAKKLFVSPDTVKSHRRSLYRKLGAHSQDEAIAAARRQGLLS
ncbi:LuxR C-terminal-related transcriptional regulator [Rhodococcus sp. ABRD24]|uniref:helix-turn-helix transcriptional regulator n=1 Tax=Rhodococcus sp. ABRD24 TaxID=2507582 RepID=UPI0013F16304|nr:LuxR C-terminal-related transcriptional regulator [Rhodococcus sp. ABRD24]